MLSSACSPGVSPLPSGARDSGTSDLPHVEYKPSRYECVVGQTCLIPAPVVSGAPNTFAIAPNVPAGMAFDTALGSLAGTPAEPSADTAYTVTVTTSVGKSIGRFTFTVHAAELPPTSLSYAQNPANYTIDLPISPNRPTHSGGNPTSYAVFPQLPLGLVLDPLTGVISGTPSIFNTVGSFKVTAANGLGESSVELSIAVNDIPPEILSYTTSKASYTRGNTATPNTPKVGGGKPTSFMVHPQLPDGLHLDTTTGVISGTPNSPLPTTDFTVIASNSGGKDSALLSISVIDIAPTNLSYSLNPVVYARNKPIVANTPTSSGGTPTDYTVSPELPPGMKFDARTGAITGTPTQERVAAEFIVTANNSGGSTSIILSIEVKEFAPTGLAYSDNPARYHVHTPIPLNLPTTTGAAPTNFAVSPPLPTGLSLSATTGIISGTPTVAASKGSYTVTASTPGGEHSEFIELEVEDDPPTELTFAIAKATYLRGTAVIPNRPTNTGGLVTSYRVNPALPAGLELNSATGEISGTPTAATAEASYMVVASNGSGETNAEITIVVHEMPPSELGYAHNPVSYQDGSPILVNTPSSGGGPISRYSVEPALPTGLTLDSGSGAISGVPIGTAAIGTYTVTAANESGVSRVELVIEVKERIPGIYRNNVLLLDKAVSTTYDQPLIFPEGAHTLEVAGSGDYTITGSISGPGTVRIAAGDGNTLFLSGPQLNTGLTITSGTLDLMALKWDFGVHNRMDTGIIHRYANPKDLSSELRAWFDASNTGTIFRDSNRRTLQRNGGGEVNGWTNIANPDLSASRLNGMPNWSPQKDAIVLNGSAFIIDDLGIVDGATVLAVVETTGLTGNWHSIFTGSHTYTPVPVMLGSNPHFINNVPAISAAFRLYPQIRWHSTDAVPIQLNKKQLFGASYGSTGTTLEIDGLQAADDPEPFVKVVLHTTYRIGRRWDYPDFWNGNYYEIVLTGSPGDIQGLTGYMAWHNNLNTALPDNHRYKNAPPKVTISALGIQVQ